MILAVRTDKPEAELYLLDANGEHVAQDSWEAHRQLAATLVERVRSFLGANDVEISRLTGIIVYTGAGSFTGLRIGTTVANALAYAHSLPITSGQGESWMIDGLKKLANTKPGTYVVPTYDKEPNITKPN